MDNIKIELVCNTKESCQVLKVCDRYVGPQIKVAAEVG